jgi:hypothetical protein
MPVLKCGKCGRTQRVVEADQPGGVTPKEAEHLGWRQIGGRWECPFCTGNTSNLRKMFDGEEDEGK